MIFNPQMSVRQFGSHFGPNDWSVKWPADEIYEYGLVPVPGIILDFHQGHDPLSDSLDTQKRFAADIRPFLAQCKWIDQPQIAIVEWQSSAVLGGLPRQVLARELTSTTGNGPLTGPTSLDRKRFIERFGRDVYRFSAPDFHRLEHNYLRDSDCDRDHELSESSLNLLVDAYLREYHEASQQLFPQALLDQIVAASELILRAWTRRIESSSRSADSWLSISIRQQFDSQCASFLGAGSVCTHDPESGGRGPRILSAFNASLMEIRAGVTVSSSTTTLSDEYNSGIEKICELISQVTLEVRQADCAVLDDGVRVDNISIPLLSPSAMIQIIVDRSCVSKSAFRGLIGRVSGADVAAQLSPKLSERCDRELVHLGTGFPAAQGAAVGVLCCDPDNANALVAKGYPVIFCANTPGPEQMTAVFLASGLLFGTGGATSHVAVIARGAGLPCILGIAGLIVDTAGHYASFGTEIIREGEWIAMDGNTGSVYRGKGELEPPPDSASMSTRQLLKECDKLARIHVYANADTASEAGAAYGLGAQGIGLCRIEHMLLRPERLSLLQRILVALFACQDLTDLRYTARRRVSQYQKSEGASELLQEAELKCLESRAYQTYIADLRCLEEFLTDDIRGLIDVSAGRNVVIRLLDPPLSEFLNEAAIDLVSESLSLSSAVKTRLRAFVGERNPMLGLRGIRLCLRAPELTDAQLRGIFRAAASSAANLCPVNLDILVPFVSDPGELIALRSRANSIADEVLCDRGGEVRYRVGAMVETPRAAILSEEIARVADFLSFGTNDLTQFTWACSRDSSEGSVFSGGVYCDQEFEPFSIFDKSGVGRLIALAISSARRASPDITIGVCGEYGGDPRALEFFGQVGVNYVSCALSSIPVARLRAGQLSLEGDNFGD